MSRTRLYTCPYCATLFQAQPEGKGYLCPNESCREKLWTPTSAHRETALMTSENTRLAIPARTIPLDTRRLLELRVWAARVRDREGEHAAVPLDAVAQATTLCKVIDQREKIQADNARQSQDTTIALLVGILVLMGVRCLP